MTHFNKVLIGAVSIGLSVLYAVNTQAATTTINPGTNTFTDAITSAMTAGDILELTPGDYILDGDPCSAPRIPEGVTVRGMGANISDVKVIRKTATGCGQFVVIQPLGPFPTGVRGIVENIAFSRSADDSTAEPLASLARLVINNCTFDGNNIANGVSIAGSELNGVEVMNMSATGTKGAVRSDDPPTSLIYDTYIHDNASRGIFTKVQIDVNMSRIVNNGSRGIDVDSGVPVSITDSIIALNSEGIFSVGDLTIQGCTIYGNTGGGVTMYGAGGTITDSIVADNGATGIEGSGTSDYNDAFHNGGGSGCAGWGGVAPGANDLIGTPYNFCSFPGVDPVFESVDPTNACFLALSSGTPAEVLQGSSTGSYIGAVDVCPPTCIACAELETQYLDDVCDQLDTNPPTSMKEYQALAATLAQSLVDGATVCGEAAACVTHLVGLNP
tara:strand:- start:8436 stop:9764 length:1329 start_codon:yes stop_codon:yes gene_type:complete